MKHKERALEEMRYCLRPSVSPFDHAEENPDGSFLVVVSGAHFTITLLDASGVAMPDSGDDPEEINCGQCEGTGTTDAMGYSEECPVCGGSGRIAA